MSMEASIRRAARSTLFDEYAAKRDNSIIAMDANGCTVDEIALELSLHPTTVRKVLREAGR